MIEKRKISTQKMKKFHYLNNGSSGVKTFYNTDPANYLLTCYIFSNKQPSQKECRFFFSKPAIIA